MVAADKCQLLGGIFSTLVQASLGVLCVSALIIKRHNEVPQRDWYVWFLDVMKQAIGSSFGHFSNIFLSVIIAASLPEADECQWYCLTYVVDSTVGTFINIVLLKLFENAIRRFPDCKIMNFGDYGNPPQLCIWFPQLIVWMCIVVVAKFFTLYMLFQFIYPLNDLISVLFSVFHDKPEIELVLVMVIIPTIMNTIQFWVTDTFLKRQEEVEVVDSELDEELMSGDRSVHNTEDTAPAYRTAAPMRTTPRISTTSTTADKDTDGIALNTLNKKYSSGYTSVNTDYESTEGESPRVYNKKTDSPIRQSTIVSSLLSVLPSAWVGSGGGSTKLQRAGSDETLESAHNVVHSTHGGVHSSNHSVLHSKTVAVDGGGKTYASGGVSNIKQRSTGVYAATAHNSAHISTHASNTQSTHSMHNTSIQSMTGGNPGASGNTSGGGATRGGLRSGSLDSDDVYL